jgi:hypothetical protein
MPCPVLTTDDGTVLEPPELPPFDAPIEDRIAHMRAVWAHNDRVAEVATRAFERAFRKAIKKP